MGDSIRPRIDQAEQIERFRLYGPDLIAAAEAIIHQSEMTDQHIPSSLIQRLAVSVEAAKTGYVGIYRL